jgi:hypothetical protein
MNWKAMLATVYALICVFDFLVVPSWRGITDLFDEDIYNSVEKLSQLEPSIQVAIIEAETYQHEPFTLKGGGLFHLSFGALLTGSAVVGKKKDED